MDPTSCGAAGCGLVVACADRRSLLGAEDEQREQRKRQHNHHRQQQQHRHQPSLQRMQPKPKIAALNHRPSEDYNEDDGLLVDACLFRRHQREPDKWRRGRRKIKIFRENLGGGLFEREFDANTCKVNSMSERTTRRRRGRRRYQDFTLSPWTKVALVLCCTVLLFLDFVQSVNHQVHQKHHQLEHHRHQLASSNLNNRRQLVKRRAHGHLGAEIVRDVHHEYHRRHHLGQPVIGEPHRLTSRQIEQNQIDSFVSERSKFNNNSNNVVDQNERQSTTTTKARYNDDSLVHGGDFNFIPRRNNKHHRLLDHRFHHLVERTTTTTSSSSNNNPQVPELQQLPIVVSTSDNSYVSASPMISGEVRSSGGSVSVSGGSARDSGETDEDGGGGGGGGGGDEDDDDEDEAGDENGDVGEDGAREDEGESRDTNGVASIVGGASSGEMGTKTTTTTTTESSREPEVVAFGSSPSRLGSSDSDDDSGDDATVGSSNNDDRVNVKNLGIDAHYYIEPATIIKTRESINLGATFLNYTIVTNLNACLVECWITDLCDTAIYQESPVDFSSHLPVVDSFKSDERTSSPHHRDILSTIMQHRQQHQQQTGNVINRHLQEHQNPGHSPRAGANGEDAVRINSILEIADTTPAPAMAATTRSTHANRALSGNEIGIDGKGKMGDDYADEEEADSDDEDDNGDDESNDVDYLFLDEDYAGHKPNQRDGRVGRNRRAHGRGYSSHRSESELGRSQKQQQQQQQQLVGGTGASSGFYLCYLFQCAKPDGFKCQFSAHNYYTSSTKRRNPVMPNERRRAGHRRHDQTNQRLSADSQKLALNQVVERPTSYSRIVTSPSNHHRIDGRGHYHDSRLASIRIGQEERNYGYDEGGNLHGAAIAILFGIGATGMLIVIVGHKMKSIRERVAYKSRRRSLVPDADFLINTILDT